MKKPKVAVILGSKSDMPQVEKGIKLLEDFGVSVDLKILSAHRTPEDVHDYAKNAQKKGVEVILAGAGKAAALPGVIAAYTAIPVIGVPMKSSFLDGMDSLLSMVQMPEGIPVGCVGVGAGVNAALYAVQILSLRHEGLTEKIVEYRAQQANKVRKCNDDTSDSH